MIGGRAGAGYLSGGGLLFLVVAAVGLFSGYLYWLKNSGIEVEKAVQQALKEKKSSSTKSKEGGDSREDQFHFDFFSMLPEEEYVGIEERKPEAATSSKAKQGTTSSSTADRAKRAAVSKSVTGGHYLIQMGAFRSRKAADQHKAELILMGISNVQIHSVKDAKGAIHRVNVGPFQSFSSAEHQQALLKDAGYNSFLKKYKPASR